MGKEVLTSRNNARIIRIAAEIGILAILTQGATIETALQKQFLSSDPGNHSWRVETPDEVCYTNESPKLSDNLKSIVVKDAVCPTIINGQTNFDVIRLPFYSFSQVQEIK